MTAANPARERSSSEGESSLVVQRYPNNVLLFVVEGHLSHSIAKQMIAYTLELTRDGERFAVFHDWSAVTGYDHRARLELTRTLLTGQDSFVCTHIYTTAREVRFGVEVANIVLGYRIDEHSSRESFEAAMQKRLIPSRTASKVVA